MNIGAVIFKILGDDATLVAALGGTKKVYPIRAAQGTAFPYIVYNKVSTNPTGSKDGGSTLDIVRMQFDCYGKVFDSLYIIEERLRSLIDQYRGTVEGIDVDSIVYLSENETWEDEDDIYRISADYSFRIHRNVSGSIPGQITPAGWDTQLFTGVTTTTLTVNVANLPTTDLDLNLEIYRDGRLLLNTVDFTTSANVITLELQPMTENFLVKFKKS